MRALRAVALTAGAVYLLWRLLFTADGAHPVMFFLLLAAVGMLWPIIGGRLAARRSRIDPVGLNE